MQRAGAHQSGVLLLVHSRIRYESPTQLSVNRGRDPGRRRDYCNPNPDRRVSMVGQRWVRSTAATTVTIRAMTHVPVIHSSELTAADAAKAGDPGSRCCSQLRQPNPTTPVMKSASASAAVVVRTAGLRCVQVANRCGGWPVAALIVAAAGAQSPGTGHQLPAHRAAPLQCAQRRSAGEPGQAGHSAARTPAIRRRRRRHHWRYRWGGYLNTPSAPTYQGAHPG